MLPLDPSATRLAADPAGRLPARLPGRVWAAVAAGLVLSYGFLFTVVHPYVDTRICVARLDDPLFRVVPFHPAWYHVSHDLFYVVTVAVLAALIGQAVRGEHRPLVRFGAGVSLQALLRSVTLVLLPLCRATIAPGHPALAAVPTIDLGFMHLPWRSWATNDLMFSGHVGEFLILSFAVWAFWPTPARVALVVFQVLQVLALLGTRGHYTVDIVVAVPFAFFADRVMAAALSRWTAAERRLAEVSAPTAVVDQPRSMAR